MKRGKVIYVLKKNVMGNIDIKIIIVKSLEGYMKYIIRADYYSDGNIIPIGLTNERGNSYIIRNVGSRTDITTGEKEFECVVNGKKIVLIFSEQRWKIKGL